MANRVSELLRTAPAPLSAVGLFGGVLLIVTGHPAAAIVGGALILFAMLVPFLRLPPADTTPGRDAPQLVDDKRSPETTAASPTPADAAPGTQPADGPVLLHIDPDGEGGLHWHGTSEQLAELLVPPPPRGPGKSDEALARQWATDEALIRQVRASLLASIGEKPRPRGKGLPQP